MGHTLRCINCEKLKEEIKILQKKLNEATDEAHENYELYKAASRELGDR